MSEERQEKTASIGKDVGKDALGLEPHQREYWLHPGNHTPGVKVANGPTILLASGRYFDLLDPEGSEFGIFDIAAALSKICRFTGHVRRFYSVAEHSVYASLFVPAPQAVAALLHDAAEAFIGDVSRPLKALLPEYKAIEKRIEVAIEKRFANYIFGGWDPAVRCAGLSDPIIKSIDAELLNAERLALMSENAQYWEASAKLWDHNAPVNGFLPRQFRIVGDSPDAAFERFMARAEELGLGGNR